MEMSELTVHSEWMLRIFVAALNGCLIGYERSSRNKEAGLRTHAIVSLSAALIMVVSKYGFGDVGGADTSRIAAQIVSGVGFLGAGVIFVKHGTVSGLTTAAGMWATAGVGMCIGAGLYDVGIVTTLLIISLQMIFHKGFFLRKLQASLNIHLEIDYHNDILGDIQEVFQQHGLVIYDIKMEKLTNYKMFLDIEANATKTFHKEKLMEEMMQKEYLKKFYYV